MSNLNRVLGAGPSHDEHIPVREEALRSNNCPMAKVSILVVEKIATVWLRPKTEFELNSGPRFTVGVPMM
jgi:hypothetical protein